MPPVFVRRGKEVVTSASVVMFLTTSLQCLMNAENGMEAVKGNRIFRGVVYGLPNAKKVIVPLTDKLSTLH